MRTSIIESQTGWERRWDGGPLRGRRFRWLAAIAAAPMLLMVASWAADRPAPASAEEPGLTVEMTCAPESFRPNEWVAVECITRRGNESQNTLSGGDVRIASPKGSIYPQHFVISLEEDGELVPVGTTAVNFEGRDLEPGQVLVTRMVVLLSMSEGTYESELEALSAQGQVVLTTPIRYTASPESAEPPTDLQVSHRLAGEQVDEDGVTSATYRTVVTNQGSSTVTELKVANRYSDAAALVQADPAPASEKAAFGLAYWDLASFGKESLAPGEWVELRTTYGHVSPGDCGYLTSGVVVEATVDGQERRYGARGEQGTMVGDCNYEGPPGTGDGGAGVSDGRGGGERLPGGGGAGPMTPPGTGEGMTPQDGDAWWAAAVLTAGGVALCGVGLALRRRARLGPRIY